MNNNQYQEATVYIPADALTLGPAATQDDLNAYAARLARHLCERFHRTVIVEQRSILESVCPDDSEINEYVAELEKGGDWVALLNATELVSLDNGLTFKSVEALTEGEVRRVLEVMPYDQAAGIVADNMRSEDAEDPERGWLSHYVAAIGGKLVIG